MLIIYTDGVKTKFYIKEELLVNLSVFILIWEIDAYIKNNRMMDVCNYFFTLKGQML